MDKLTKVKEWINENAPMLNTLYQNKYVGMAYDRFASMPPKQQKQTVVGGFSGLVAIVIFYLLWSYWALWSAVSKNNELYSMASLLQQFQKTRRDKTAQIQQLERNSQLAPPGQLRDYILSQAKAAAISPRMVVADEKGGEEPEGETKGTQEVTSKTAQITVDRVNLLQLKNFLSNLEFGRYNLHITTLKIINDERLRGYMKAEMAVVAHLMQAEEGS